MTIICTTCTITLVRSTKVCPYCEKPALSLTEVVGLLKDLQEAVDNEDGSQVTLMVQEFFTKE